VFAYADEPTELLKIDYTEASNFFGKIRKQKELEEKKEFLIGAIPELRVRSKRVVEKILKNFEEETFVADYQLIREGQPANKCFIVKQGECRIVKQQDPNLINLIHKSKNTRKYLENKMGYFSKTTNSFQIGIIEQGQWAGDEIFAYRDEGLPFSIVTKSITQVYSLKWTPDSKVLPRDVVENL
jgi:hypothetical protein